MSARGSCCKIQRIMSRKDVSVCLVRRLVAPAELGPAGRQDWLRATSAARGVGMTARFVF